MTRRWNDRQTNEKKEETTWFRVACRSGLAGIAEQYVRKGTQIMVVGRVSARAYLDNNNQPAVSLDLNADTFQMLSRKDGSPSSTARSMASANYPMIIDLDTDIPF